MKSDRLLSILLLLQTRGLVPASELAERLEVSVRTIYRDVDALSAAGVPVYAERGRHGGITLLPGFRTDVTGLTEDESRALFVLASQGTHAALGLDAALRSALRKVMAALPEPHRPAAELTSRRILVDPARWLSQQPAAVDLDVLTAAVFTDRRLRLSYRRNRSAAPDVHLVDPYGLVVKAGVWYLVADEEAVPRLFRADRVARAEILDEDVRRRPGLELTEVWETLRRRLETRLPLITATVLVHRDRLELFLRLNAHRILSNHQEQAEQTERVEQTEQAELTNQADQAEAAPAAAQVAGGAGWHRLQLGFSALGEVGTLLTFGSSVRVLTPPEAREQLARTAADVVALYGTG
ncbi:helix-turn-helix transcriptional regulator [Streptomyces sp. NPDC020412]|uniref:helix-turn-helix transcriptional regulator n=1 Tax=Streptomyces sp. NPDC020412 TaxID=3365073 RepID=UPI0037BAD3CA